MNSTYYHFEIRDKEGFIIRTILMVGASRKAALEKVECNCIHKGNGEHVTHKTQWHCEH